MYETSIQVGGIPIRVRAADQEFVGLLQQRYSGFLCSQGRGELLDIELHQPVEDADAEITVRHCDGQWLIQRGDFEAAWDPANHRGKVLQAPSPYALDSALRIIHSLMLSEEGGFLIHAASAIRHGRSCFFAGVSEWAALIFLGICDFATRVPGYRMIFRRQTEAWDLIE